MNELRFEWVTTSAGLDALRPTWQALDDGAAPGAVFRSWEWQATWWSTLGRDPRGRRQLRVLVGRDADGRARAILPLYVEDAPVAPLVPRKRVRLLADGTVGSDYLGLVAPAADQATLAPAFARRLATDPTVGDADLFELTDVLDGDPLGDALASALAEAGCDAIETVPRYRCPLARWDDLDTYLATRPNHFGSQVRNRRKELSRKPGFQLEVLDRPDAILHGLEVLFELHRARWAAEGGSEAFPDRRIEDFHRAAARLLAERGWARLGVLQLEGRPIAAAYGFHRGGTFAYYQAGMLPEWRKRSAGMVVMVELMRRAHADGAREFDFLRGDEPYKQIWATELRTTKALHAVRATGSARRAARVEEVFRTIKREARERLPEPAIRALRRVLRATRP